METEPPHEWPDGTDDVTQFADALRVFAERAIRRISVLTPDDARDITHQGFLELWEEYGPFPPMPMLEQMRRAIDRVADRLRKRRGRRTYRHRQIESEAKTKRRGRQGQAVELEAGREGAPPRRQVGVPTLCPHLAALGKGTRFEAEIVRLVAAAAILIAADRDCLKPEELGFFTLAWRRGRSAAEIALIARVSPRAMTERLRRISNKVENGIAWWLHAALSQEHGDRLADLFQSVTAQKESDNFRSDSDAEVYERVIAALDALVHRDLR